MARGYLTKREWDALLIAQHSKCCVEGCDSAGPFQGEHSTPNAFHAAKPDQLMCVPCHRRKTKRDIAAIAKAKRLNGETLSQYERRRRFGPSLKSRSTFQDRRNNG